MSAVSAPSAASPALGGIIPPVPVLVGIHDTSFAESVEMARHAAAAGADAVVLAPPHCLPAGQPELLEHLRHLAPELPPPLMLHNMPAHSKLRELGLLT